MARGLSGMRAVPGREGDRVTTLELFFDLAFVFAFTQVSQLMAHEHSAVGVLQGIAVLALLWWAWTSYGWLANLAHADRGWVRIVMLIAMGSMFVVGVVVPEAFHDLEGGLFAPLVFVGAYLLARIVHGVAFPALSDPGLRRRSLLAVALLLVPTAVLLTVGAVVGSPLQVWLIVAAVVLEPIVTRAMSSGIDWWMHSAGHFAERHGLIVILALGESIIAIGVGVAQRPMSLPILAGIALALLISATLWWAYFSRLARPAEKALAAFDGTKRANAARDGYTYLHLMLVAGIVLVALGLEEALAHAESAEALGWFGAAALGGGGACYLAGTGFFARRIIGRWTVTRFIGATALVAVIPVLASVPALIALVITVVALIVVLAVERVIGRSYEDSAATKRTTIASIAAES